MNKIIPLIAIVLVCCTILGANAKSLHSHGQELVSHLHDNGQLGTPKVRAIVQDQQGFLWIGSEHGLFRYDGYDFKAYRHDSNVANSIAEDKIYALHAAKDGRLWVGTKSTLTVYDPQKNQFFAFQNDPKKADSLANNEVYRLYEDKKGGIWASTYDGLSHLPYGAQSFKNYRVSGPEGSRLSHSTVYDVIEDRHGKILVASDAGIDILDPQTQAVEALYISTNSPQAETDKVYNFFKDSHGKIWIGTYKGGLMWLAEDDRTVIHGHPNHKKFPALPEAIIRDIIQANENEIWVSVYGQGIAIIDRQSGKFLRALTTQRGIDSSLANDTVHTMLKDKTGLIWLGYLAGNQTLSVVNSNAKSSRILYSHGHNPLGLDIKEATAMGTLGDEGFLFAGEGLNLIDTNNEKVALPTSLRTVDLELRQYSQSSNENPIKLSNIKTLDDGSTIIAYQDRRIKRYRKSQDTLEDIKTENFCNSLGVSSIIKNHVWFTCNTPSLLRVNLETGENQVFRMESPSNIKYSYTNKILIDNEDTLWVSSEHGLFSLKNALQADGDSALFATHLLGQDVRNIHIDKKGSFWADTTEGIYKRETQGSSRNFKKLNDIKGAPQGSFFLDAIIEDKSGRLWGNKGVFDSNNKVFHQLDQADGYYFGQSSLAEHYSDEELLFSTPNGVISVLADTFALTHQAANLVTSNVLLDGKPLNLSNDSTIDMKSGESTLYVEVSVLDFTAPNKNRFSYNLQSDKSHWQNIPKGQHSLLFSNLAPGSYTLYLRGKNSQNIDAKPEKKIDIEVLPQWYQSTLFKTAVALLLLFILLGFYRLRAYQYKQEKLKLSKLVADRTQELKVKNDDLELRGKQLSTALDELVDTQEQLLEKEKMAALGELVSGVAHEVNTPLGVSVTAASHLHDSSRSLQKNFDDGSLTQDILKKYLSKTIQATHIILANLNRSADLISNFKNISVDQHNEVFSKINLTNYIKQILDTLSPTTKNSNCKMHLNCPPDIILHSYPGIIAQLLTNLVNNSVHHGCSPNKGGNIYIDVKTQGQSVLLIHRDDGVGIPKDIKRKIYDPFFTTKRGKGGSGLGLSIVFNLVTQRLGGSIQCSTEAPEGATFEVILPMNLDKTIMKDQEEPVASTPSEPHTPESASTDAPSPSQSSTNTSTTSPSTSS